MSTAAQAIEKQHLLVVFERTDSPVGRRTGTEGKENQQQEQPGAHRQYTQQQAHRASLLWPIGAKLRVLVQQV